MTRLYSILTKPVSLMIAVAMGGLLGCEVDSFFDPSRTGRFEFTPTLIPVLDRIDVIEPEEDYFARATPVTPDDLIPSALEYSLYPGDIVTVRIFELYQVGAWFETQSRIDAGGYFRVPELGDVRAAGLSPQQFEDELTLLLQERVVAKPQVDVVVVQASGLRYTISGFVRTWGMFTLQTPDLRLMDALAIAGGVSPSVQRIYVIRQVALSSEFQPQYLRPELGPAGTAPREQTPVDIEELIERLDEKEKESSGPSVSPGMFSHSERPVDQEGTEPTRPTQPPPIDVDELEPVRVADQPPVDIEDVGQPEQPTDVGEGDTFIFVPERGEWVRVRGKDVERAAPTGEGRPDTRRLVLERIIEVDYQKLLQGDSSYNIVVRPGDRIHVDGPPQGNVYVDGEISRPGVYTLPAAGKLTLSRFIAAAGGLSPLAMPERVDLIREIGSDMEATVRLNLAGIRQRTEPDVVLKPNDHVIVGTSWIATPLAVIRSGFRVTYGFGFLLDRNFGPDVFGAEPRGRF